MISTKGAGALVASLLSCASMPALAQSESAGAEAVAEAPASDIVVTGSRIARPELQSAMPVSVISPEDARTFGRNTIYDTLLLNPAIGAGVGEMNSGGQIYEQGVANINLRNLGTNRSLVLVDGQRWVSGGARTSAVDLNTIPTALIDRYEVVTGGAAAIYGADAVSGAVNIVMKKRLSGVHLSATSGISGEGDARQTNASIATGGSFDSGRGSFVVGGEFTDTAPMEVLSRYSGLALYYPNPANTGPNDGIPDNLLNRDQRQLHRASVPTFCLPAGAGCQQWYQIIGNSVQAVPRDSYQVITGGPTGTQIGGPASSDNSSFENVLLRPKSQRASFYGSLTYDLTPAITWTNTFSYAHSYTRATPVWPATRSDSRAHWWGNAGGEVATLDNPYLPSAMRDFMVANNLTSVPLGRTYMNLPRAFETHKRNNVTFSSNIGGNLSDALNWQGYVRYGQVIDNIRTTNMVGRNEWLAGRYPTTDASGQIVCADPAAQAAGCVPFNIFETGAYSDEVIDYLMNDRIERTKNTLFNAGASINGDVLKLPYGNLAIAAGAEWRRETLHTRDDPDTDKLSDIIWSGGIDYQLHPALDARRDTTELFGEAVLPILADLPFARRLEIEGAYRYSNYLDSEDTQTWKVGGTWEPVIGFSLRGVYSRSVRVPNFGELYSPTSQVSLGNIDDPCQAGLIGQNVNRAANCAALMPGAALPLPRPNSTTPAITSGGNTGLTPETSNSITLGAVVQPRFLPGFDLTVDYWDVKIDNVITSLPYLNILNYCVDGEGGPNQAYCRFVTRNDAGEVTAVQATYANLAEQRARGIDFSANYRIPIGEGMFRANLNGTYLLEQNVVAATGQKGIDYAGQWDFPRFKATLMTDYSIGKFSFNLNTRFVSRGQYNVTAPSDETYEISHIPAYVFNDVTFTLRPSESYDFSIGVKNVSDVRVPIVLRANYVSPGAASSRMDGAANYDAIGRYLFARVNARF